MQHFDCDKIQYEGPDSKNALSFKHYNATEEVGGKAMKDHLRFGAAYWHVMRNELADPFGAGTAQMPWDDKSDSVENALARVDVFFEFLDKIKNKKGRLFFVNLKKILNVFFLALMKTQKIVEIITKAIVKCKANL